MSDLPVLGAVWAQSLNAVIGRDGGMPWYAPEDLAHFKEVTLGSPVIMGRKTWESFPEQYRPLPDRENFVVTSRVDRPVAADGALWVPSFDVALRLACEGAEKVWLIGGSSLFSAVIDRHDLDGVQGSAITVVERTVFEGVVEGDSNAPDLDVQWLLGSATAYKTSDRGWILPHSDGEKKPLSFRFERWTRGS